MAKRKNGTGHSKHQYVVGYHSDRSTVYGRDDHEGHTMYCDPMTLFSAKRYLTGRLQSKGVNKAIYKLVPVAVMGANGEWRKIPAASTRGAA